MSELYTSAGLRDMHERGHETLKKLEEHCRSFSNEELGRELAGGFGYPTLLQQLHHAIGAEEYWIGVVEGKVAADDDADNYPTIDAIEAYRAKVFSTTDSYLRDASAEELNTPRPMKTWDGTEVVLAPARIFVRTLTHIYQHQGQIVAMCRQLGSPISRTDFPIR